jgi:hypothetical protein
VRGSLTYPAIAGVLMAGKPRKSVGTYSFSDVLLNRRILSTDRAQGNAADIAAVQGGETRRVSCFLRGSSAPYPGRLRQGDLDISRDAAQWTPFWSVRRRPVPVHVEPAFIRIRTRRLDRREWNVGRPDVFVVITCVLGPDESRQETDLVVPAADAPLVTAYLNGWPGHGS